jgi:hypothetical protein
MERNNNLQILKKSIILILVIIIVLMLVLIGIFQPKFFTFV